MKPKVESWQVWNFDTNSRLVIGPWPLCLTVLRKQDSIKVKAKRIQIVPYSFKQ